ncbi:MAG: hypothetical protein M3O36_13950 [Myxococcota bacterium]|nr:hypothetical protein [Myxococcota bacterium]
MVIARTTYGVLPSRDGGAKWTFLCEGALGIASACFQDPELGITSTNAWIAGLYLPTAALNLSSNSGCAWNCVGGQLAGQNIADIVGRPDSPDVVLALASTCRALDAGGGTFNQIFRSVDDGANWLPRGNAVDPNVLVATVDVVPAEVHRIYMSGTRGVAASRPASQCIPTDDGAHWLEGPVSEFDPTSEDSIYIGGVDPVDPDRVSLRSSASRAGPGQSQLFGTTDAGISFAVVRSFTGAPPVLLSGSREILGFALSPDGAKVDAETRGAGLFIASRSDLDFRPMSNIHVQYLATRGAELWACSHDASGFIVGMSANDVATSPTKLAGLTSLAGPIDCGHTTLASLALGAVTAPSHCDDSFDGFCAATSPTVGWASGSADAGTASTGPASRPGCDCHAAGSCGTALLYARSALALVVGRRRARRPAPGGT